MVFLRRLGAFAGLVITTTVLLAAVRYTYLPGSPGPPFVRYLWLGIVALPAMLGPLMAGCWALRWPWLYGPLAYCLASGLAAGIIEGMGEPPVRFLQILVTGALYPVVVPDAGSAYPSTLLNALSFALVCLLSWLLYRDSDQRRVPSRQADSRSQGIS